LKCCIPVKTIAMPCLSQASTEVLSLREPPGCIIALIPAAAASTTSGKGKNVSEARTRAGLLSCQGPPFSIAALMAEPDETIPHMPSRCRDCPCRVTCESRARIGEKRQVVDALITKKVTEHQALVLESLILGTSQKGEFSPDFYRNY